MGQDSTHEEGCYQGEVTTISLSSGRLRNLPSYRGVWRCGGCLPNRFAKRVQHIPALSPELCMVEQKDPRATAIRVRAHRANLGFLRLSLENNTHIVLGPPKLFPNETPRKAEEVLRDAMKLAEENGLRRLSFSEEWRPESEPKFYAFHTGEKDKEVVKETYRRMGLQDGDKVHGDHERIKAGFFDTLEQVKSGREDKVDGEGYWE